MHLLTNKDKRPDLGSLIVTLAYAVVTPEHAVCEFFPIQSDEMCVTYAVLRTQTTSYRRRSTLLAIYSRPRGTFCYSYFRSSRFDHGRIMRALCTGRWLFFSAWPHYFFRQLVIMTAVKSKTSSFKRRLAASYLVTAFFSSPRSMIFFLLPICECVIWSDVLNQHLLWDKVCEWRC